MVQKIPEIKKFLFLIYYIELIERKVSLKPMCFLQHIGQYSKVYESLYSES